MPSPAPDWIALAVFAQPHGVSGRIKLKSFTDPADEVTRHPTLYDEKGTAYRLKLTGHAQGMAIVAVDGVRTRDDAERLRGRKIGLPREAMPTLDSTDHYYTDDLVGMTVVHENGEAFGQVQAVANYGASDILVLTHTDGSEGLYAFTHRTFPAVDLAARRITICPPELWAGEDRSATE